MRLFRYENKTILLVIAFFLANSFLFSCSNQEKSSRKFLESANAYMDAKEYDKAEIELRNALQKNPRNEDAYIKLSEVYRILEKRTKEIQSLVQVVAINPDNMEAQYRLGQVFLLGRQTKRARETAQTILSKNPDSIKAYHMLATAQVQERNPDAAIKTLNKAIDLAPDNPHLYLFLGYIMYYHKKDLQSSETAYLKAISIDKTILESYQELSIIYTLEKKFDKAEALLIDLTHLTENRIQNLSVLAGYYEDQGQIEKAENVYKIIIEETDRKDYSPVYNMALFHARHRNFETAIDYFNQALALDDSLKIRESLATVYLETQKYEKAQKQADYILNREPNNAAGRLVLAQLLIIDKKYAKALEKLEQIIAIDKENVTAFYLKAVCLMENDLKKLPAQEIRMAAAGNISAEVWKRNLAIDSLKAAINLSPDHFTARLMLADIYIQNEELVQAEKQIEYILEKSPNDFRAFFTLGNIKIFQNQWDTAERVFKQITEKIPRYSLAHVKLGVVYNAENHPEKAVKEFQTALDMDPLNMDALRYIVNTYMSRGQKESALKILNGHSHHSKLTSFEKGYIEFLRGKIALSEKKVAQAKKHFNTSLQINAETTPSIEALARISEIEGNKFVAIKYYELILSYSPEYIPAYMNLARIYQTEKDRIKTKEVLEKILEIKDNHGLAANELAYILATEGNDLQKALHLARIAESQDPENPDFMDTLGWVYYKQKSYDLAIHKLLSSLEINPDNPITNYHLGWAYYDTGRYEQAREYMKTALKLNPNFEGAQQARNVIGE